MRLIDADALIEKCGDWYVEEGTAEGFIGTLRQLLSGQPETNCSEIPNNSDTISRQRSIDTLRKMQTYKLFSGDDMLLIDQAEAQTELMMLPSVQPERLTDDDFETIRIHLNAYKEKLCNQQRWEEAEEYQRIIDRFMAFASAQPESKTGRWIEMSSTNHTYKCSVCGRLLVNITDGKNKVAKNYPYCHCGADMRPTERNSNV